MIAKYNKLSLAFGAPGIILQIAGLAMDKPPITIIGTIILLVGFAYYAKAKGRSPAWCLAAFLGIIGLLLLSILKDKTLEADKS